MSKTQLYSLLQQNRTKTPVNLLFQQDICSAIEAVDRAQKKQPSPYYKPSSLNCIRQMYYVRMNYIPDIPTSSYQTIGMADTGTRRHEAIQEVLQYMEKYGYPWRYLDVADYVLIQQARGQCLDVEIVGTAGAETKLFDHFLQMSYRCDGLLEFIPTNSTFLFEFKNQISFKAARKTKIDDAHLAQISAYSTSLELDQALILYENRDTTELICPDVVQITDDMKQHYCLDRIFTCEEYIHKATVPSKSSEDLSKNSCKYCVYQNYCRKD